MQQTIRKVEDNYRKAQVVDVHSGDTVRVHQKIKEGEKERIQIFEGFVIRTDRKDSLTSRITVRRISGGVGVEKSFLLHSPLVTKIEVVKRSKVRRKNLTFMRQRSGKSARLAGVDFDKEAVNTIDEIIDAVVGEAKEAQLTDVTKKEEKAEVKVEKPADEPKSEATPEKTEDVKSDDELAKENPELESEKKEEPAVEEKKELSKKEKAEAFRKSQEEKKK